MTVDLGVVEASLKKGFSVFNVKMLLIVRSGAFLVIHQNQRSGPKDPLLAFYVIILLSNGSILSLAQAQDQGGDAGEEDQGNAGTHTLTKQLSHLDILLYGNHNQCNGCSGDCQLDCQSFGAAQDAQQDIQRCGQEEHLAVPADGVVGVSVVDGDECLPAGNASLAVHLAVTDGDHQIADQSAKGDHSNQGGGSEDCASQNFGIHGTNSSSHFVSHHSEFSFSVSEI